MRLLGSSGSIAALSALLAATVHPDSGLSPRMPSSSLVLAALSLLLVVSLAAAGRERPGRRLMGLGGAVLLLALGYDAVRGHAGTLSLRPGQGARAFEEVGPGGPLGLRPLGFDVRLEEARDDHATLSCVQEGASMSLRITRERAASCGGFRFAFPEPIASGEPARLRIRLSGAKGNQDVELAPGQPAEAQGLTIALERYFADFALDEKGQPFSRSAEPRNPAALLQVRKGDRGWRVFVIRSLPGIHRQEGLDASFALVGIEPEVWVRLSVAREPAAALGGAGLLLLAAGLSLGLRRP